MMKILVTGFDPFGGEKINPSIEAVKRLPEEICGARIIREEIPTCRVRGMERMNELIARHNPDIIVSVGQAGGRASITVERVGINVDDYGIPDNDGDQPQDEPIVENGPAAYFTTLPIKKMVQTMRENGIPAAVSNTAGTFVCNHVIYETGHLIETKYPGKKFGFIHIPYLPEQVVEKVSVPSMPLEVIVKGLNLALKAIVED
jgi:pyroglutamyl-peptidase